MLPKILLTSWLLFCSGSLLAQELQATVNINHAQIQGTDNTIFDNLQTTLMQFLNDRKWTTLQFQKNERISCSFNITVNKYDRKTNTFSCKAIVQANRPVFNSSYTTTLYNNIDNNFDFEFAEFSQLDFNEEHIDNQLTALCAYYAYLIIGMNLDSFSPMGGTDILQQCLNVANNAQGLNFTGWKIFDDDRNRYAFINGYMDEALKPFRMLQYDYYRTGLDEMANNVEKARVNITTALENDLQKAHENRPLSMLPQIWTDYKKDELVNIYKIPNAITRQYNYEKMLTMYNDTLQGKAKYLGIIMGATPQTLEDKRRGIYSYEALRSRLAEGKFSRPGMRDLLSPVIRLDPLTPEEMLVLCGKLADIHAGLYDYKKTLDDKDLGDFIKLEYSRIGASENITPREVIRDFIELLDLLYQNPNLSINELLSSEGFDFAKSDNVSDDVDENFVEFTL